MRKRITNFDDLARSPERRDALSIVESAYHAIDTANVIRNSFRLDGTKLSIRGDWFDLSEFERVFVVGFGKASCDAIATIETILKGHIKKGIALDIRTGVCEISEVYEGTHPHPSHHNVDVTKKILDLASELTDRDFVIVVVSGGGSALLCYPYEECDQGMRLYEELKHTFATITEMNTVRKHISEIKGGGLAKVLYPATVASLIFCDIPGENFADVASGPTFLDRTTVADAQVVLDRYGLKGYTLKETPKDIKYFERMHNIPLISNIQAIEAMTESAHGLGYLAVFIGAALYDEASELALRVLSHRADYVAALAGGEPRVKVAPGSSGKGGRCVYTALSALEHIALGDVFVAFATDGVDNSEAAGAIVDASTLVVAQQKGLDHMRFLRTFNSYPFFEATNDLIITGPTDANVSDLFFLLSKDV